jgi:DNA-binding response OmpR family regulator
MNTILLVEDDVDVKESIAAALEDCGFSVVTAAHGREALAYLRHAQQLPALILLDLMMPVMDGWQFRSEQLRDPAIAGVPVVVLSAVAGTDSRFATMQLAGMLYKPLDLHELLSVARRFCNTDQIATQPPP